jgi:hypothetical protein
LLALPKENGALKKSSFDAVRKSHSPRQSSGGGDPDAALTVGWRCRRPQRRGRYRVRPPPALERRPTSRRGRRAAASVAQVEAARAARARGADMPETAGDASAPSSDTVRCARPTERHPPRVCLARLPACRASELQRGGMLQLADEDVCVARRRVHGAFADSDAGRCRCRRQRRAGRQG